MGGQGQEPRCSTTGVAVVGIGARSATEVGEVVVAMEEAMTTAVEG